LAFRRRLCVYVAAYRARKDYGGFCEALSAKALCCCCPRITPFPLAGIIVLTRPVASGEVYHFASACPYLCFFAAFMVLGALTNSWSQVLVGYRDVIELGRSFLNVIFRLNVLTIAFTVTLLLTLRGKGPRRSNLSRN
jgi:hypothetical protein